MGDLSVTKTTKEASSHFFFEGNVDWWSSIKFLKNITMNNTMNTTIIGEFFFFTLGVPLLNYGLHQVEKVDFSTLL